MFKTPNKTITPLDQPFAVYKRKLRNYAKRRKINDDTISDIMLYDSSKKQFFRHVIYRDYEVGID